MGIVDDMYIMDKFYKEGLRRHPKTRDEISALSDVRKTLSDNGYIKWMPIGQNSDQYLPNSTMKGIILTGLTLLVK